MLFVIEAGLETFRTDGNTTYSITRYVEVLSALIADVRLLARQSAV